MHSISFQSFRKGKTIKAVASLMLLSFVNQFLFPTISYALTSGPSQPEVQSFEPVGTSEMVNLFNGDFVYNLPLFELPGPNGGYPFNMAYHSGIGMDQESSWTGLGWNLNPGAINRSMRGLPDDFMGDKITKTVHSKPHRKFGLGVGANLEVFGADLSKSMAPSLGAMLTVYYNNYRGVGYSLDPNFSLNHTRSDGQCAGLGIGMGLSLDSQEGVGVNASLSLSHETNNTQYDRNYSLGANLHSNAGLGLNMGISKGKRLNKDGTSAKSKASTGGSSSFSFSQSSYTPMVTRPTSTKSLSLSFKSGSAGAGIFGNMSFKGFYNTTNLKDNGKPKDHEAYGYQYLENASEESMTDFNRAKDGMITKSSPNLGIPSMTYDYYNIQGQGTGGMFRPYRSEVGQVHDPKAVSESWGGSYGVDIGAGADLHIGAAATFSYGRSESGEWDTHNDWKNYYQYHDASITSAPDYEPVYYKVHGEHTSFPASELDHIGGEGPLRASLKKEGTFLTRKWNPEAGKFKDKTYGDVYVNDNHRPLDYRMPRNMNVQPLTNADLGGNDEVLGEYDLNIYTSTADYLQHYLQPSVEMDRTTRGGNSIAHHHAGYSVLNQNGQRYVYGLPAYNVKQVDRLFTVDPEAASYCGPNALLQTQGTSPEEVKYDIKGSKKFFSKTEMPAYAHAYLLTSLLGADYVDVDGVPGPSDGDFGYWVKFNYVQTDNNFKWRAPFADALYNQGLKADPEDDQGSFMYGEKEIYHLATAETKSHIAVFHISPRADGHGPLDEFNKSIGVNNPVLNDPNSVSYKLDKIQLFPKAHYYDQKAAAIPLKTVHFAYDYSLCPNVLNNDESVVWADGKDLNGNHGKLTLKKVWFTYQENNRGRLSPYEFDYGSAAVNSADNPAYSEFENDRWGNFKPLANGAAECENLDYPYVNQFDRDADQSATEVADFKTQSDQNASAWHLKSIKLPTGGTINVTYEADDYAYVQHRTATQMFKIRTQGNYLTTQLCNVENTAIQQSGSAVYFDLEEPLLVSAFSNNSAIMERIYNDYIKPISYDGTPQLYFRVKMELRDGHYEHVSGYADIETDPINNTSVAPGSYGVAEHCIKNIDGQDYYTKGFVLLKPIEDGNNLYNPFSAAAWQHMRINYPELLTIPGKIKPVDDDKFAKAKKVRSLVSIVPATVKMFSRYRNFCKEQGFGLKIKPEESWIRLGTPDKVKIGGGSRVVKLAMTDNWSSSTGESSSEYGQVYTYRTAEMVNNEATGRIISSGVATYEPMIGGDEIALRHAKHYPERIPVFTDNNLFFELPVNESYYPGPSVGYSKVTVRSLNTAEVMEAPPTTGKLTTASGVTVHEFYTAHDYPVLTDETPNKKNPFKLYIPIPAIGQINVSNLTASQGYSVILNDMHGKQKATHHYALNANGGVEAQPISSVEYIYQDQPKTYDGVECKALDNKVSTIISDYDYNAGTGASVQEERLVGVEYEFFTDQRKSRSESYTGGLDFNTDALAYLIPIPTPWPSFFSSVTDMRTAVTNKIIHKSGILKKVVASDGLSEVTTENILFDAVNGQALLTTVTNNYEAPIYNYSIPGHWMYEGMGAASKNSGMRLKGKTFYSYFNTPQYYEFADNSLKDLLVPGDEFIATDGTARHTITFIGLRQNALLVFHSNIDLSTGTWDLQLSRSGSRNLLTATVGQISALDDPTANRAKDATDCVTYKYIDNEENVATPIDYVMPIYRIDNVLNAGAVEMSDNWPKDFRNMPMDNLDWWNDMRQNNPYATGEKGIWLPRKSYVYVDERDQTTNIDLSADGTFDDMALFSWQHSQITDCESNWTMTNEITAYSPYGYELENRDVLGKRSSAIYGYNGSVSTAVGTNAARGELAYESFEEYAANASVDQFNIGTGNFDFWTNYNFSTYDLFDEYEVSLGYETRAVVDVPFGHPVIADGSTVWVSAIPEPYIGFEAGDKAVVEQYTVSSTRQDLTGATQVKLEAQAPGFGTGYANKKWRGSMLVKRTVNPPSNLTPNVNLSDAKAHTGTKSLLINQTTQFEQIRMQLEGGKTYVLSAWVAEPNSVLPTTPRITAQFKAPGGSFWAGSVSAENYPQGKAIDGWRKIEFTFTVPVDQDVAISFTSASPFYCDDVRIYPFNGNMSSYVYDPFTLDHKATLDPNNYSAQYSYDLQGQLYLSKKETAEGILTIQEVRSHTAEK